MLKQKFKILLLVLSFAMFSGITFAGTTGGLVGKVVTEDGMALPGVVVVAKSPSLQGQKSTSTDSNGKYRLILLPPGVYEVTFSMSGFQTLTHKNIKVDLDNNFTLNVVLKGDKLEESIVVTAETPLIDNTSTTSGSNYTNDYIEQLPTARNAYSVLQMAPGVTGTDASGSMIVNGASGTESNYIIDGMNTTSINHGTAGKGLNFDFVEEIQVKTGGYEAEFGRSTGGVVNMITKSGSNEFHGSVFYYWQNPPYAATMKSNETTGASGTTGEKDWDYGFSIGGPIIKDKLWFFIAYNRSELESWSEVADPLVAKYRDGQHQVARTTTRDYWSAKLTYNINENNTLVFSAFGDPRDVLNPDDGDHSDWSTQGALSTDVIAEYGGTDFTIKYDSILNENIVLSAQYGRHNEKVSDSLANGGDIHTQNRIYDSSHDLVPFTMAFGGAGFYNDTERYRDQFRISGEFFLGNHDVKFGLDYEKNTYDMKKGYGGGHYDSWYGQRPNGKYRVRRRLFSYRSSDGELVDTYFGTGNYKYLGTDMLAVKTDTINTAFFLQDKWNVTDTVMISAGVRWETQEINGNKSLEGGSKYTAVKIDDNIAPRFGFTWDVFGDGTSKLYGSWGKFYMSIPLEINVRAYSTEAFFYDYYEIPGDVIGDRDGDGMITAVDYNAAINSGNEPDWFGNNSPYFLLSYGRPGDAVTSKNLKGSSTDQFIFGFDKLVNDLWTVGVKFTYNSINDIVEDISYDYGNHYIFANPGRDIIYDDPDTGEEIHIAAADTGFRKPKRNYRAYELTVRRKFSDSWNMNFSLVRSDTWGEYTGGIIPGTGQVDPALTSAYDLPTTTINSGMHPNHRPYQIKLNGTYAFDNGFTVGYYYRYYSGTPIATRLNVSNSDTIYGEFNLMPRGAYGQRDAVQTIDLNISYSYSLENYGTLEAYFYVNNVFNFQNAVGVYSTFARVTDGAAFDGWVKSNFSNNGDNGFAGFSEWLEGRFTDVNKLGEWLATVPGIVLDSDEHEDVNGNKGWYGKATSYQSPRVIRFGVKWKF
jgi:outer membrane receptor for ferrienterochelin and colicin